MAFLLDTNVCIEYLRGKNQSLRTHMQSVPPSELQTCSIVVAELYYGAYRSGDLARNIKLIEDFLLTVVSIPVDHAAGVAFGQIRHELEQKGQVIGPYDMLIAAVALSQDLTLVTKNQSEFRRVPGLLIESW